MKQEIIKKFGLIETNIYNGVSFVNNIVTYHHPRKDYTVYFSLGDPNGNRLKDGLVGIMARSKTHWIVFQVPEQLLMSDDADKYIDSQIQE